MIRTRFGETVEIVKGDIDKGEVDVKCPGGEILKTYIYELKADGGLEEICNEIKKKEK